MTVRPRIASLVEERTAIRLRIDDASFSSIARWIDGRARLLGLGSAEDYVTLLEQRSDDDDEWLLLIATVSNGQTAFFRDRTQMAVVGDAMVELAKTRATLQIWCAGCSTGEEAYTVAAIAKLRSVNVEILATDIDTTALERARSGRYGAWSLRRFPPERRGGLVHEQDGGWVVDDALRAMVQLARHNLATQGAPQPRGTSWDIVLCRNVLIYFDDDKARAVFDGFASRLAPDGWLFVGPADALRMASKVLQPAQVGGRTVFRHARAEPRLPESTLPPARKRLHSIAEPLDLAPASGVPSFERAQELMRRARFDEARDCLLRVLAMDDARVPERITLGNLHLGAHRYEAAADAYAEAHRRDPLVAELHYFQAMLHKKTGNLAAAADACRRALFLEPTFWPAASLRASVLFRQGDRERGRRAVDALGVLLESAVALRLLSCIEGLSGIYPSVEDARAMVAHYQRRRRP